MFIKICGLTTPEATRTAVTAGADAIGFVFAESPRRVSPERATELCADVPDRIVRVAVMRHPSVAEWHAVRDGFAPDWLQTDAEDLAHLDIPSSCEPLPVYRTGRITADEATGRLLYEGIESGRGELADWSEAAEVAAQSELILAGGLNPDNVGAAIAAVGPWGVDVSSGVESAPGRKDPDKIIDFIARARATETLQ